MSRNWLCGFLSLCLILSSAFRIHAQTGGTLKKAPARNSSASPVMSPETAEAKREAQLYFGKLYIKCGKSYYAFDSGPSLEYIDSAGRLRWLPGPPMGREHYDEPIGDRDPLKVWEFNGLSFERILIQPQPLSPADRQNGIKWQGDATVSSPEYTVRTRYRRAGEWQAWSDFADATASGFGITLQKRDGGWLVAQGHTRDHREFMQAEGVVRRIPACSYLPIN
jgi:hypothetical protein